MLPSLVVVESTSPMREFCLATVPMKKMLAILIVLELDKEDLKGFSNKMEHFHQLEFHTEA